MDVISKAITLLAVQIFLLNPPIIVTSYSLNFVICKKDVICGKKNTNNFPAHFQSVSYSELTHDVNI